MTDKNKKDDNIFGYIIIIVAILLFGVIFWPLIEIAYDIFIALPAGICFNVDIFSGDSGPDFTGGTGAEIDACMLIIFFIVSISSMVIVYKIFRGK